MMIVVALYLSRPKLCSILTGNQKRVFLMKNIPILGSWVGSIKSSPMALLAVIVVGTSSVFVGFFAWAKGEIMRWVILAAFLFFLYKVIAWVLKNLIQIRIVWPLCWNARKTKREK